MAHSLPSNESFSDSAIGNNGGPYWDRVSLYWSCRLWSNAAESDTGFAVPCLYGGLHDGYTPSGGMAVFGDDTAPVATESLSSLVFRPTEHENVNITLVHNMQHVAGTSRDWDAVDLYLGLLARVVGASGTDFETTVNGLEQGLRGPSCYGFFRFNRPTGDSEYQLIRVTGPSTPGADSTLQVLATEDASATASTDFFAGATTTYRFTCVSNGGVAELRGYRTDPDTGVEAEVISFDDGDTGVVIIEPGHCGFAMTSELRRSGSNRAVMTPVAFQVDSMDTGTPALFRDEFDRTHLTAALEVTDRHSTVGNMATGQFTGDQAGEEAGGLPIFHDRLRKDTATGTGQLRVTNAPPGGWHLAYNPATNPYVQGREVTFNMDAGGSGERIVAVALRMSLGENANWEFITTSTESIGYAVAIHYDLAASDNWVARVHRYGDSHGVIAERVLNQTGDAVTFSPSTDIDLGFAIQNRHGANAATGHVHLDITFDQVSLGAWANLASGVIEEDDATLTDTGSRRILSGEAEGFYATSDSGADDFLITDWTQLAVTFDPGETEQASVTLPLEKDGQTGTLTFPPEWPVETQYIDYSASHRFDSRHVHRHRTTSAQRRRWNVRSGAATESEVQDIASFFQSHDGPVLPFAWTSPDEDAVVARLAKSSLRTRKVSFQVWELEFSLMECL